MNKKYTCPMHPEVISDEPGKCPKCGGMDLVPTDEMDNDSSHKHHDHSSMMAIPAAAGLFIPFRFRLTPAVGALLMSASSVIVVMNAMSSRKVKLLV